MTPIQYFPNAALTWVFVIALLGLLFTAGVADFRTFKVPKALTLALLVGGFVMSLVRGGWNGADGRKTWLFDDPTLATGIADGALFSLAGFAAGFGIFFGFWILGIAGGGDLKVVASLGAWLGPTLLLGALLFSFFVVVIFTIFSLVAGLGKKAPPAAGGTKARKRVMSFTLPLAIAVALFCLAVFQYDLGLATRPVPVPAAP